MAAQVTAVAAVGSLLGILVMAAAFANPASSSAKPAELEIYFIDVEGGQSTLIVTPKRQSLLIDTGWAGNGSGYHPGDPHAARDANRILAAAHDAGIKRIDYLLITHFHTDHDGGVKELSQLIPIGAFIDHGAPAAAAIVGDSDTKQAFDSYKEVRAKGIHLEPRPGDHLPLAGVDAIVVASAASSLAQPLPNSQGRNAACQDHAVPPRDPIENPRSTGVVISYGEFRFLDVGDLTGQPLFDLACPNDLIGPVDAYLVAHHGGPDAGDPATFAAFKPRIAIMNNGLNKGGALNTYQTLHEVAGLESVWQLHASASAGESNFAAGYIANLDESTSHWIKLVASADGSFRVFNQRTGEWKSYPRRARDAYAGAPSDPWKSMRFLMGTWEAKTEGGSAKAAGSGTYSFQLELKDHVLARHSGYESCKAPGDFNCAHGDLLYVYRDLPDPAYRAVYFDNEGHVIHYDVSASSPSTVTFLSNAASPGPQFRLVYALSGTIMTGKFQMRMPGQTEFSSYLEWSGAKQ